MQLSRPRFGAPVLGGSAYWVANVAVGRATLSSDPPRDVAPVLSDGNCRGGLGRSTPEEQSVSSAAILAFMDEVAAAGLELHSEARRESGEAHCFLGIHLSEAAPLQPMYAECCLT